MMPKYTQDYLAENKIPPPPSGFEYEETPMTRKERIGVLIANIVIPGSGSLYYGFSYDKTYYKIVGFI